MYLKSLHIQGFKTFELSTTLELSYPLTAIVGPNGSGKSNLVDALRWVLCEQNLRTLRARSMLDLIFAGSATRHPVNYAEAEVVFNNEGDVFRTGSDMVSIARRVFRSRESNFLIDGNDVQLRDVEDLLTSTGLGFRHYPFIGQGEMSRVFTMKPEERKGLFEEVAGIAEYKQRKRDTLVKLEETRVNIARVEDLLTELHGSLDHLSGQAAAARQYVGYQKQVRELEMDIARARYLALLREQERATARLAEAQEKMAEVLTSLAAKQAAHDDAQTAQHRTLASLREQSSAVDEAREEAHRLEKELVSVREKARYLAAEEDRLVRQGQDWEASRTQTARLAAETEASLANLRTEEGQAAAALAAEQERYAQLVQKVEERRKALAQAQGQVIQLEAEVRQLFARFNPLQFELDEKQKVVEAAESAGNAAPDAMDGKQAEELSQRADSLEAAILERRGQLETASGDLATQEQTLAACEASSREAAAAASSYRELLKSSAAFVARLEQEIRKGSADRRVLDVVDLGERKAVLLQVLREELGYRLSDDPDEALARAVCGTGEPALSLRGTQPSDPDGMPQDVRALCVASWTRLATDAPPAVAELVRRLFVVPSLSEGLTLARATQGRFYRIYCDDGVVIDSACVVRRMSGPVERSFGGGDSAELARLEQVARDAAQAAQSARTRWSAAQDARSALVAATLALEKELKDTRSRLQALTLERERRVAVAREREAGVDAARSRIAELKQELEPLRATLAERRGTLARAHDAQERAEKDRQKDEAALLAGKDAVQALEIRHSSLSGRVQTLLEKKLAYEDQLASLATEIKASQDGLARVRSERATLAERIAVLETQFRDRSNALAAVQAAIDQLELQKRRGDEQLNLLAAEMENVGASRTRLEGRVRELEVLLAEDKGKLEQFTSRDDASELMARPERSESVEQMQAALDEARQAMTNLEPVNMASIRESEELATRIERLQVQDDDLTQSRQKLLSLIDDLDRRASEQFEQTYAVIEQAFQENFVKMFDGGEARLVRQENGELTGIDIDVVLPGKRRQPLELLSGGEKVLTAAALQFALFRARPSLFYLLDEVDSALDENNVHRFARLLREQEASQFIVVTHNRETMLAADVLYGVTMQESGVSKVVSLRLDSPEVAADQE